MRPRSAPSPARRDSRLVTVFMTSRATRCPLDLQSFTSAALLSLSDLTHSSLLAMSPPETHSQGVLGNVILTQFCQH